MEEYYSFLKFKPVKPLVVKNKKLKMYKLLDNSRHAKLIVNHKKIAKAIKASKAKAKLQVLTQKSSQPTIRRNTMITPQKEQKINIARRSVNLQRKTTLTNNLGSTMKRFNKTYTKIDKKTFPNSCLKKKKSVIKEATLNSKIMPRLKINMNLPLLLVAQKKKKKQQKKKEFLEKVHANENFNPNERNKNREIYKHKSCDYISDLQMNRKRINLRNTNKGFIQQIQSRKSQIPMLIFHKRYLALHEILGNI